MVALVWGPRVCALRSLASASSLSWSLNRERQVFEGLNLQRYESGVGPFGRTTSSGGLHDDRTREIVAEALVLLGLPDEDRSNNDTDPSESLTDYAHSISHHGIRY